jgi:hypothetical protein
MILVLVGALRTVNTTADQTIHLQFNIITNALEIRAIQSPNCIVRLVVECTLCKGVSFFQPTWLKY